MMSKILLVYSWQSGDGAILLSLPRVPDKKYQNRKVRGMEHGHH